jgi:pyruvate kinase
VIDDPHAGPPADQRDGGDNRAGSTASAAGRLAAEVEDLRDEMRHRHVASADIFARVHRVHRRSAQNLVDYLTLRSQDIRPLQASLAELGLSSLGRAEEHVIATLESVLDVLHILSGRRPGRRTESAVGFGEGQRLLRANTDGLLGPAPGGRNTRILVTMPTEAATDAELTRELVRLGMDCARINCAHDEPEQWAAMVGHLRAAAADAGRPCPILMDLPGPKLRTGPIEPGPNVLRLRPRRDARGQPTDPAGAVLVADGPETPGRRPTPGTAPVADRDPAVPVPEPWLAELCVGDRISLQDTRGSARELTVTSVRPSAVSVEVWDTTYLETGSLLVAPKGVAAVGDLAPVEQSLRVHPGDTVTVRADLAPVPPEGIVNDDGTRKLVIGCTLPAALDALRVGHRVWFDDGRIGGTVIALRSGEADVSIDVAAASGSNLKAEKGINIPDSDLRLPAVGPQDEPILRFVADHADLVGLSFAQHESDISALQRRLDELGGPQIGIILKIETARGFNRLPELLLAGMASERVGVMVARGDLAVECGFLRLAEVQEEILWLCDAAHVPVVWATEVLDQMARTGRPSRAEISDAAMSTGAECVMLNKGPHIGEAVSALDDILRRMGAHQHKKVALLRRLRSWSPEPS